MNKLLLFVCCFIAVYSYGQCVSGNCENGTGKFLWTNESYEGEWKNAKFDGQGTYTYSNGETMKGIFKEGQIFKGEGLLQVGEGDFYRGAFDNGVFHGQGTCLYKTGKKFVGYFENGAIVSGVGFIRENVDYAYEGEIRNRSYNGQGKVTYSNGETLSGEFKDGNIFNGEGYLKYSDSTSYKGGFKNGKYHGNGKAIYNDGSVYTGVFVDGSPNGTGILKTKEGRVYSGTFSAGELVQGEVSFSSGVRSTGTYKNWKLYGYGEVYFLDGTYKGNWVDGKRNGYGKFTDKSGNVKFDGQWKDDAPVQ